MWNNNIARKLALSGAAISLLSLNACSYFTNTAQVTPEPTHTPAPVVAAPTPPPRPVAPPRDYSEPTPPRIVMFDPITGQIVDTQANVTGGADFHQVVKGDTLFAISKRYGCTVEQLMAWNNLRNPNNISVGQNLRVRQTNS
jgi:Tfp pilus assembly protein FimV